ncbi:DUF58 domain-containing protein [Candidatus Poribacteria bacterium]|nr:DUF58 domain-containing protein [Candidatus Poribacteria bacterium]
MRTSHKYLDPVALSRLGGMELVARLVVEGFITGLHKSPYQGFSVEFAEHRQYMPGDEIRYIDWKVYGKSDRYYIKKFEEETNLRAYILLDASGSMNYRYDDKGITKFEYGCYLAASLTYLMLKQRDSVGLAVFDTTIKEYIPPRGAATHLHAIMSVLEKVQPGNETHISAIFHELAKRIIRRGLVIVVSDLLDQPSEVLSALKHFRHRKHEVIVFHLLDKAEMTFPFQGPVVFRDMETGRTLPTQAEALKAGYLEQLTGFIQDYRRGCGASLIDYVQIDTATPFDYALSSYLARRK